MKKTVPVERRLDEPQHDASRELAWPVTDAKLRQQIIDECLVAYLCDDRDAWTLNAAGTYDRAHPGRSWCTERLDGALRAAPALAARSQGPHDGLDSLASRRGGGGRTAGMTKPARSRPGREATRMAAGWTDSYREALRWWRVPRGEPKRDGPCPGRKFKIRAELLPGGTPQDLLELVRASCKGRCWWWATSPC